MLLGAANLMADGSGEWSEEGAQAVVDNGLVTKVPNPDGGAGLLDRAQGCRPASRREGA